MFASRSSAPGKAPVPPPQSIEAVRRRARHRLIGAAVLVLLGVIGFPLLFDTEPRPISIDIPIEIPAKNPKPALPAASAAKEAAKSTPAKPTVPSAAANDSLGAREEVVESGPPKPAERPAEKSSDKPVEKTTEKPAEKPEAASLKLPAKTVPASNEAERARALLQGKPVPQKPVAEKPVPGSERLVVQVGAFAEAAGAREVRSKLERAGLKTYTHVAETPQGLRTRVRVGPFDSRAEAEKAAARVKALGLPAAILTL
jgi:DedD protein